MSGCPGAGRRGAAGLPPPPQRGARLGSGQRSGVSGSAPSSRAPPDAQPHSRALRLHARGPRSRPPLCLVWSGRQRERVLGGVCLGVQSREAAGGQGRGPREGGWRHGTPRFLQLTEIRAGGRQGRTRRGGGQSRASASCDVPSLLKVTIAGAQGDRGLQKSRQAACSAARRELKAAARRDPGEVGGQSRGDTLDPLGREPSADPRRGSPVITCHGNQRRGSPDRPGS